MSRLLTNALSLAPLRHLSVAGFVVSTMLLAACGGGGSASGADSSRLGDKSPYTEKKDEGSVGNQGDVVDGNDDDDSVAEKPTTDTPDSDKPDTDTDTGTATDTDDSVAVGGDEVEPDTDTEEPSTDGDSGLVEDVVSAVSGAVRLEWDRPEFRENGEYLEGDDIGGYELRYRQLGEDDFQTIIVENGWEEDYEFSELVGSYQFSIAAFDNNGLYSEFVSLSPATGLIEAL